MNNNRFKIYDENGNAVIEATFVVTITIFVLFLILSFGFVFYQETQLQNIANETAVRIARTYSYEKKDPITGFIGINDLKDKNMKLYSSGHFFNGNIEIIQTEKAKKLAETLNNKYRLMTGHNFKCEVSVRKSDSSAYQREILVSIEEEYNIPFAKFLGIKSGNIKRQYYAKAQCFDILLENSCDNFVKVLFKNLGDTNVGKIVKYLISAVESGVDTGINIAELGKKIMGLDE